MNKEITENILLEAGFKEKERIEKVRTVFKLTSYDLNDSAAQYWNVTMTNYPSYCGSGRKWDCEVSNNNGNDYAEVYIQTIDHFNKLMEIMDVDFKLKE